MAVEAQNAAASALPSSVVAFIILGQSFGGILTALLMQTPLGAGSWQSVVLNVSAICVVTTVVLVLFLPESPRYLLLRRPDGDALRQTLKRLKVTSTPAPPHERTAHEALVMHVPAGLVNELRDLRIDGRQVRPLVTRRSREEAHAAHAEPVEMRDFAGPQVLAREDDSGKCSPKRSSTDCR